MATNGLCWFLYGLMIKEPPIWTANLFATIMGLLYSAAFIHRSGGLSPSSPSASFPISGSVPPPFVPFLRRSDLPYTPKVHVIAGSVISLIVILLASLKAKVPLAILSNLVCAVLFASPLSAVAGIVSRGVCKPGEIPLPFTMFQLGNCLLWSYYGFVGVGDPAVYIPNFFGTASATLQAAVVVKYQYMADKKRGSDEIVTNKKEQNSDFI